MSTKRINKTLKTILIVLTISVFIFGALFINSYILNNAQLEALEELEQHIGEYDEGAYV